MKNLLIKSSKISRCYNSDDISSKPRWYSAHQAEDLQKAMADIN